MSDDGLLIMHIAAKIPILTLVLSLIFYNRYKVYPFFKYFILYNIIIIIVDIMVSTIFIYDNITLYNVYTFFEFNSIVLVYYHLIKQKTRLKIFKFLAILFNLIYIISFSLDFYVLYTIPLEGVVNSIFVVLFFIELLNSERILNYKKLFSFWMSVGFLVFYLTSVPFWSLYYSSIFNTRDMFPIIYYLATIYQLIFIYALIACKKMENSY